jgi:hypothetical protein
VIKIEIELYDNHLIVHSSIYFDDEVAFCRRPYVSLAAHKEKYLHWDSNTIGISIHDYDDFDIGIIYKTDDEHFTDVLHELINWMIDHEKGISSYWEMVDNPYEFFPDCGCERKWW